MHTTYFILLYWYWWERCKLQFLLLYTKRKTKMASGNHIFSAAILLVASYFICLSNGVTQDILPTVCYQPRNQETCEIILESDPRTKSADLPLLSVISLELSMKQASKTYNTFLGFRGNSTDPGLISCFGKCVELCRTWNTSSKLTTSCHVRINSRRSLICMIKKFK